MHQIQGLLITGGTGSFGKAFVKTVLAEHPHIQRLVVYSRDELKQYEMEQVFSTADYPGLRYFIGDVRDHKRLHRALEGIDTVIHAAALKQVPAAEYNPFECIKTNILGAQNLIEACLDSGVKRVIALSTDKAAAPVNLYGATKLCSDKLFIAANNVKGHRELTFAVVRYGNVMGSRGSVIPFFLERRHTGVLPITDPSMTRFNISLQQGVDMVRWALNNAQGGELFVPKIPSYRITDVAKAIGPDCEHPVRYGNVMGSRGSVIPFFLERRHTGVLPITDPSMTRFNISLQQGVDMVRWALNNAQGGELFVPKIPSYRITDVAKAIGPDCEHPVIGIRAGEKIHEEMITASDSFHTVDLGRYFAILPMTGPNSPERYIDAYGGHLVPEGFAYNSGTNPDFLSVEQLRALIREHLDPNFTV